MIFALLIIKANIQENKEMNLENLFHRNPPKDEVESPVEPVPENISIDEILAKIEQAIIREALISCKGNMSKAAKQLGLTERMIGTRVKKYSINYHEFRIHADSNHSHSVQ
jgi:Nif-specific regulatory protein